MTDYKGWIGVALSLMGMLGGGVGIYAASVSKVDNLSYRVASLETRDSATSEILNKLNQTMSDNNVIMGRLDERLKRLENREKE